MDLLKQEVIDAIPVEIAKLLADFREELQTGFSNFPTKFKIGFSTVIKPSSEGNKFDMKTEIAFEIEPKIPHENKIKDHLVTTIDTGNTN